MTAWSIQVDPDLCVGSGDCALIAPDAFRLGPSDQTAVVLATAVGAGRGPLIEAAFACPTGAITIVTSDGDVIP